MKSFNKLLEIHKRLDELFLEQQRWLLRLDLKEAAAALWVYTIELFAHMQDEEEWMIPMYRERAEVPVGGAAEIFLGEHDKMRQYLLLFKEELTKMAEAEDLERAVMFLLDSQHIFKRLLVHHDTRERKMLYPLLDEGHDRAGKGRTIHQVESVAVRDDANVSGLSDVPFDVWKVFYPLA